MAVHYYQEKDVNPTKEEIKAEIKALKPKQEKPKQEEKPHPVLIPKPQPKKKAKKVDDSLQLSLFD